MAQSKKSSNEPVTAVFSWTVKPGKEQLFRQIMHDIHKVARTFPGHMGVSTLNSPSRKEDFQTILRFDTTKHLEAWLNSPIRKKMIKPLAEIVAIDSSAEATGLETWFEIPGQLVTPPPRWKMVVTTFIAIYPLSLLYGLYVAPNTLHLSVYIRALFLPIFAPIILTYLIMPFLTQHVFKRWLYKQS